MKLTKSNKAYIDNMSYTQLLHRWRFALIGDPWFQDETGEYWGKRMQEMRQKQGNDIHVKASKLIGWDKNNEKIF